MDPALQRAERRACARQRLEAEDGRHRERRGEPKSRLAEIASDIEDCPQRLIRCQAREIELEGDPEPLCWELDLEIPPNRKPPASARRPARIPITITGEAA